MSWYFPHYIKIIDIKNNIIKGYDVLFNYN